LCWLSWWLIIGNAGDAGVDAVRIFAVGRGPRRNKETRAAATARLWGRDTLCKNSSLSLRESGFEGLSAIYDCDVDA